MDDTTSNSPACFCKERATQETPVPVERRDWLSPEQVAELLGIGRTFTYALLKGDPSPAIPSYKIGRLRRVRRTDVEAYMEEKRCQQRLLPVPAEPKAERCLEHDHRGSEA
jgi:excisionase family DNA binding protein